MISLMLVYCEYQTVDEMEKWKRFSVVRSQERGRRAILM